MKEKTKEVHKKDENESLSQDTIIKETSSNKSEINRDTNVAEKSSDKNIFLFICIIGVTLGILLEIMNLQCRPSSDASDVSDASGARPRYWVYGSRVAVHGGPLQHVHRVLTHLGYQHGDNHSAWQLLWSHDYPFRALFPHLHALQPHQRVNHFPGTGFITNKVDLATSRSPYIPRAFKLPQNKAEFVEYASEHEDAMFLMKHNQHRGIHMRNVTQIAASATGDSFVQSYVQNPLLVDGHKFDIGVYVVLTSVDPLRVYWYKGDVLFRYCPVKYHPFDPLVLDKYVIGDDYLPTWQVPSLALPYTALSLTMKEAFEHYAHSQGWETSRMWADIEKAITEVFVMKERHIIDALKNYPSSDNFFELMRFDLVVDDELGVHLLEANMSPNLSSAHFPPNRLLYEQLLYNLFTITGVANHIKHGQAEADKMVSDQKNIGVYSAECSEACRSACEAALCGLCPHCMEARVRRALLRAHTEFIHRGDFKRLYPPPVKPGSTLSEDDLKNMTRMNKLQYLWYQGKCNVDVTWCY